MFDEFKTPITALFSMFTVHSLDQTKGRGRISNYVYVFLLDLFFQSFFNKRKVTILMYVCTIDTVGPSYSHSGCGLPMFTHADVFFFNLENIILSFSLSLLSSLDLFHYQLNEDFPSIV